MQWHDLVNHMEHADNGCIVWTRAKTKAGYGIARVDGVNEYIHRIVWEWWRGPIPTGLTIDHLCRNTTCCNVEHLRVVPIGVNVLAGNSWSGINARKTHCVNGHPFDEANTLVLKRRGGERSCRACAHNRYLRRKSS